MRLSPAPNNYPSGLRSVAAAGARVQFATGPIHGMRVTVRDCLPALTTMQNGTARVGGIRFQQVPAGAGVSGMKAGAC